MSKPSPRKIVRKRHFQTFSDINQIIFDQKHINGYKYVKFVAQKLKELPKEVQTKIKLLWSHPNKKRVRLERLGGQSSGGRGFVVDGMTVLDGLTRRIEDWMKNTTMNPVMREYIDAFINGQEYKDTIRDIQQIDKQKKCKCRYMKTMAPMDHGKQVHRNMYDLIRYAIKMSGLCSDKRKMPKLFNIDICAAKCVMTLMKKNLIPFTSEWPAFNTEGTGCATAIDIIAVDAGNEYQFVNIELKSGNAAKALTPNIALPTAMIICNAAAIAGIQVMITMLMMNRCYGNTHFTINPESDFSSQMKLIYVRSWGAVILKIPPCICFREPAVQIMNAIVNRGGGSLRANLATNVNTQAFKTTKGTKRKKAPKTYKIGF